MRVAELWCATDPTCLLRTGHNLEDCDRSCWAKASARRVRFCAVEELDQSEEKSREPIKKGTTLPVFGRDGLSRGYLGAIQL